jgi:hypothetical protein
MLTLESRHAFVRRAMPIFETPSFGVSAFAPPGRKIRMRRKFEFDATRWGFASRNNRPRKG